MPGLIVAATTHLGIMEGGAFAFGMVVGWNAYFINRYRKDVVIGDLSAVIAAVGGAAILKLFQAGTVLFGYYGVGLAVGFFLYWAILVVMVTVSKDVGVDWFLTGKGNQTDRPQRPMLRGEGEPDAPL